MIKNIKVINHLGESITLDLRRPEKSGFLIHNVDGIGPGTAIINESDLASVDGTRFNSARVSSRNIVINAYFVENPTIEAARLMSYKYFPIKKKIKLIFTTNTRVSEIEGYVERNEPVMFSERTGTQISIICPDPYFYSSGKPHETVFYGMTPHFEFPMMNDSLTERLINMGELENRVENNIFYSGDANVGITLHLRAAGEVRDINIYNVKTREKMTILTDRIETLTGTPYGAGDEIIINTVKGNKYAQLLRGGVYINILNCLERDSAWFQLGKGDNIFAYTADYGAINLQFYITNRVIYEGI